jgi:hypothetical protein
MILSVPDPKNHEGNLQPKQIWPCVVQQTPRLNLWLLTTCEDDTLTPLNVSVSEVLARANTAVIPSSMGTTSHLLRA